MVGDSAVGSFRVPLGLKARGVFVWENQDGEGEGLGLNIAKGVSEMGGGIGGLNFKKGVRRGKGASPTSWVTPKGKARREKKVGG